MRDIIVIDCETTGLGEGAAILEVAAVNVATGIEFQFAPYVVKGDIAHAEPKALQINRYFERGVWEHMAMPDKTDDLFDDLRKILTGNTFAGSNPTFDSNLIAKHTDRVWHHRLLDLSAYCAGVMGWPPNHLQGLEWVCRELGVENTEPHSALGDARATAECFRLLMARAELHDVP